MTYELDHINDYNVLLVAVKDSNVIFPTAATIAPTFPRWRSDSRAVQMMM